MNHAGNPIGSLVRIAFLAGTLVTSIGVAIAFWALTPLSYDADLELVSVVWLAGILVVIGLSMIVAGAVARIVATVWLTIVRVRKIRQDFTDK